VGMRGKMLRILKNMYETVESCVLLDDHYTEFFKLFVGLRQGCLISPILFAIFINNLAIEVKKLNIGIKCGGRLISILLFADGIVLLAENKKDLEKLLECVYA